MKTNKKIICFISLPLMFGAAANVYAVGADDLLKSMDQGISTVKQTTEAGAQATEAVQGAAGAASAAGDIQAVAGSQSLVDTLVQKLGITDAQAEGGAGAIFQVAKDKMPTEDFQSLSQAVPGMDSMLGAAPKTSGAVSDVTSGLSSMMGDSGDTLGSLTSLASSFKDLNLSSDMVSQFTPIMVDYVKQTGGEQMATLLQAALSSL
jgi:uncharacterized protein VcgC/VcgE DUF2780